MALNEGREVNPDDSRRERRPRQGGATLNEGREVNPDDRRCVDAVVSQHIVRSTKVGRLTPTTAVEALYNERLEADAQRRSGG